MSQRILNWEADLSLTTTSNASMLGDREGNVKRVKKKKKETHQNLNIFTCQRNWLSCTLNKRKVRHVWE